MKALLGLLLLLALSGSSIAGVGTGQRRVNLNPSTDVSSAVLGVIGSGGDWPADWQIIKPSGISAQIMRFGVDADGYQTVDVKFSGTATAAGFLQVVLTGGGTTGTFPDTYTPVTAGQTYSYSFYTALTGGSLANLDPSGWQLQVDSFTSGGTYVDSFGQAFFTPTGTLTRITSANVTTPATSAYIDMQGFVIVSNGAVVNCTMRFGAAQIESGTSATAFVTTPYAIPRLTVGWRAN